MNERAYLLYKQILNESALVIHSTDEWRYFSDVTVFYYK